ncbi:hypothetical protein BVRB_004610 [Beta vulgaris subsp. vulgaris]|uniref:Uncharacterized protein n=1 Tax=Beta vulgaris subsp. vulgaris TaxID=3555 RepID=A0A0J8B7R7_BETVV|nr:hypothetical protein BVRB_004610 [Beta vulgaris subsp. vulgaris]
MEAVGIALSAAQTLFAVLQCTELKELCSFFGIKSELDDFQNTVGTVKAVLLDAQNKNNISDKKTQLYIKQLKDAVYDADDLFDEFVTLAKQNQHMGGGKASKKFSLFFSGRNPVLIAYKMSKKVKNIRKKLDAIASNYNNFGFSVDSQPIIRKRKEDTCSSVYEGKVIGRENDVNRIIGLLLDSNIKENVSFLTIVGMGGLGKTALAQLVFNNARLKEEFSLKLWTDVADHDEEQLDVDGILRGILASAVGRFVVKSSCWKQIVDELEELKGLKSLKGKLAIDIKANCNNDLKINEWDIREGAYLRNKEHINDVAITFNGTERSEEALRLMEELQPHSNIKRLEICGYVGVGMPSWTRGNNLETFLPNLTALEIFDSRIKYMTCLGNLSHLKSLELSSLEDLEYIIDYGVASIASMTVGLSIIKGPLLFPSLKLLRLMHLPKLKGWRRSRMGVEDDYQLLGHNSSNNEICDFYDNMEPKTLPQLTKLGISECPNLECDFFCPVLEGLTLKNFNKRMQIRSTFSHSKVIGDEKEEVTSGDTLTSSSSSSYIPKRSEIKTDDVEWLINSQPVVEGFRHFQVLFVNEDDQVKILGMMMSKLSALIFLQIEDCPNLISVSVALQHLTSLKELEIKNCPNLNLLEEKREDEVDVDMPWRSLSHSLRRLKLSELPQLVDLPSWMQFLEALETLHIDDCKGLESLPNWMPKLTALRHLRLSRSSPRLKERLVSAPPGEDWPDIQHILSVHYY